MEDRLFDLESNLDKLNVKLIQMAWKIDDVDRKISEAPSINIQDEVYDFRGNLLSLENSLFSLRMRIGELEERVTAEQRKLPTLPDTNLISESLWQSNGICQRSAGLIVGMENCVATGYNRIPNLFFERRRCCGRLFAS